MSFLAKLFINGRAINVLDTNIQFYQQIDPDSFKPAALPRGGVFSLTLEADGVTDLLGLALSPDTMCEGYIRFYRRDGMSKLVDYEFFDTYIVNYQREFTAFNDKPAIDRFVLSPGILRIGDMVFEKWWKVTDLDREKVEATPVPLVLGPKLSSIKWKNIDGKTIEETTYGQKVALEVAVANPDGGSVEITIEKEDGTEFENGQKTLSFTEYLTEEGTAQLNTLKIKNEWEEFKVADVDGLLAKVSHKGTGKTSSALQLVPPPKVIVDFRPNKGYDGEYGFDFIRDKKVKNDKLTYKDIY